MLLISILPDWSTMELFERIFWYLAIPTTLILILLMVLSIFGGDTDTDVDTDVDADISDGDTIPFQFISLKNIVAFFAVFGWSGIGFINAGMEPWLVIVLAVFCGLLMMSLMATLFYLMSKLAENGTLKMNNAIGKLGEVYLRIPAERGGMGKVQLTVQGSVRTLDAITDDLDEIATASIVQVVDVIDDSILLVKKQGN
ncbi:hypothetical protein [Maribellus sp. YY47]|uniref:hypothetical protein n=1 Tax=Maribellus sp. YY47 TaxID=2929486 RepID=UPI002001D2AB|nr:hypothetical protein [Maribellus sp. YY47]MCK3682660.1 hypothetical protein [Maribellus sp. YY47]